jgi:uncharacterized glyoxalase superfamily protein PhnB
VNDDIDPVRRLRPDRLQSPEPNDPKLLAEERNKLMSMIEEKDPAPTRWPAMYPRIAYEDEVAAIEYLERVFGFHERREARMEADPGQGWGVLAWLELGDGVVMVGRAGAEHHDISSPRAIGGRNTCMINVYVDDVDAHYERAMAEGAQVVMEINDAFYGFRRYEALDLEGHKWHFVESLETVRRRRGEGDSEA